MFKEFIVVSSCDGFVDWVWELYKCFICLGYKFDVGMWSALVIVLSVVSTSSDFDDVEFLFVCVIGVFEVVFKCVDEDNGL